MKHIFTALCCASFFSFSCAASNPAQSLALQHEYEYLGGVAEAQHRPADALWFYENAASLSIETIDFGKLNIPMYCGNIEQVGRVMYFRREVCARTQSLCSKVIALNVLVEFKNQSPLITRTTRCKIRR